VKDIAGLVPKVIKALTKVPAARKANMQNIGVIDQKVIVQASLGFLKDRFNADVSVYSEDEKERYDPKNRSSMALPYQPAIFIE
jgi:hypothetical protein